MRSSNYRQPGSHSCRHPQPGNNMPGPGADTHADSHVGTHTNTDTLANTNGHPLADTVKHVGHTGLSPGVASPTRSPAQLPVTANQTRLRWDHPGQGLRASFGS